MPDVEGAFNNIGHAALEQAIGNFPAREVIKQWLKAGYVEAEMLYPTETGVPQGGVISPLLLNVALHGMEQALGIAYTSKGVRRGTYALVRYADDLVIFSPTHDKAVEAQDLLSTWLGTRGLRLSGEKTHIRHLREGFNFLGFNPTTSFDMPLCMPSCIWHDCLSICLICNVPSCCASHLIDLIERWQPHRSIGAMGDERI